jgi:hypothetical protein
MKLIRYSFAGIIALLLLANSSSSLIEKPSGSVFAETVTPIERVLSASELFDKWNLSVTGLSREAFEMAQRGFAKLTDKNILGNSSLLTIIDFSKPSTEKRLFVLDMTEGKILFNSLVAHGRNSGLQFAKNFSNRARSFQSSLGFYVTMNPYTGSNGYSLKLKGCETGINDKAYNRAIVMHGADYVSERFIDRNGYLGRSEGCPAVPNALNREIIDVIKGGSCMFMYYPSQKYLNQSKILNS